MAKSKTVELTYSQVMMAREALVSMLQNGTKMSFTTSMKMRSLFRELENIHADVMAERDKVIASHQTVDDDGNPVMDESGMPVFDSLAQVESEWAELLNTKTEVTKTLRASDFDSITGEFTLQDGAALDALVTD